MTMIFEPTSPTDVEGVTSHQILIVSYWIGMERAWVAYIAALGNHWIYAKTDLAHKGYGSMAEFLSAKSEQDALMKEAYARLHEIRTGFYGNKWGM